MPLTVFLVFIYDLISVIYYVDIKDSMFSSTFLSSHVYLQPAEWTGKKILDSRKDLRALWKLSETVVFDCSDLLLLLLLLAHMHNLSFLTMIHISLAADVFFSHLRRTI